MKRKAILLLYAVCLLLMLASCGGESEQPGVEMDAPIVDSVTRSSGLNEEELLADLNENEDFFNCFAPDAGFTAASIQINHRNTEEKELDEIYATVTSVNEYSTYTAEFCLCYRYYQEGGWRLETLYQSSDGMYSITYWPQEEDLNAVWDSKYAEIYNGGVVAACEAEETGNDYVMYLVTYYRESGLSIEFAWAEVLFQFENGLWATSSMSYPTSHVWNVNMNAMGTYCSIGVNEDNMWIWLLNLHTDGTDDTKLQAEFYTYEVDIESNQVYFYRTADNGIVFDLGSIHVNNNILYYNDGDWRSGAEQISTSNSPLTEADARIMIQQLVEENGFPYRTDWESAAEEYETNGL